MTRKEALEITYQMWDYIAEHGCLKGEAIRDLKLPPMKCNCACCEFTAMFDTIDENSACRLCPMFSLWKDKCCGKNSPYNTWDLSPTPRSAEAKECAQQIADAAGKELEKYCLFKKHESETTMGH